MLRHVALTVVLALGLAAAAQGQNNKAGGELDGVGRKALGHFEHAEGQSFDEYLKRIRPQPIPPDLKLYVMARLPKAVEVQPGAKGRAKLATLGPVLNYHERGSAYEVRIGRLGKAYVGLYACAAILISEEALDLLTAEELQAVVAHEVGHDYFWHEYQLADRERQDRVVQELELRCDGIAVITLSRLGLDPASLMSAVAKLRKFNERVDDGNRAYAYPSPDGRLKFNRAMIEMVKSRSAVAPALAWK